MGYIALCTPVCLSGVLQRETDTEVLWWIQRQVLAPAFLGVCLPCTKAWSYLKSSFLFPMTSAGEHISEDHQEIRGGRMGGVQTEGVLEKLSPRGMEWCYCVHTVIFCFLFRVKLGERSLHSLISRSKGE